MVTFNRYRTLLENLPKERFAALADEPLKKHSSWRIGGPADILLQPFDISCLQSTYHTCRDMDIPVVVIGRGSNILFDDKGFRGVVIKLGKYFSRLTVSDTSIYVEAGVFVPKLSLCAAEKGLTGLEHICGIPGSIGGLIYMNGGSLDQAIGNHVISVDAITQDGTLLTFLKNDCGFSYRKSIFQKTDNIITSVRLCLQEDEKDHIKMRMKEIFRKRKHNFPLNYPNCGSVFKTNPALLEKYGPPGKIIDQAGLKETRIGDAEISVKHANFIVNKGAATSEEVKQLIRKIRRHIYEITGEHLKCEVLTVLPEGKMCPLHEAL